MRTTLAVMALAAVWAQADKPKQPALVRDGADEVAYLDGLADPNRWGPAECTVEASRQIRADGRATVRMHIPVDHHAGEKLYPIGWPRMYLNLKKPAETSWTGFERFEFLVMAKMSRDRPPRRVINLQIHCPGKPHVLSRDLGEIVLGKWVRVSIPLHTIENVAEVARLGLNISESDYRHGDVLDFYFGAFRLARTAEFALRSLAVRPAVMYEGAPKLKAALEAVGPPEQVAKGLPLTIRRGGDVLHRLTAPVSRGVQIAGVDIAKLKLAPGGYTLTAFDAEPARRIAATFRVVESPWSQR